MKEILIVSGIVFIFMIVAFFMCKILIEAEGNRLVVKEKPKKKSRHGKVREAKRVILSHIERSPSKTIEDLMKLTGKSRTTIQKYTNELNKKKKIVILKSGHKYLFVLPSEGQNVYKHKIK